MTFQHSSLRTAGQDSDMINIIFPSSVVSRRFLDVKLSPLPGKQLYGDGESIKAWIDGIDSANAPAIKLNHADDADVFRFATHPFRNCYPRSPFSDEFESESDVSFCLDATTWAPEVFKSSYYDDSHSESSLSDDAQYVTIPSESPWFRPAPPSAGPVTAHEITTAAYASSCSSDVRQVIAQQELLLAIFHEELRRVVPSGDSRDYIPDWLEGMDADLVLAPLETYADLCWESAVCDNAPLGDRPLPDVPTGFDEVHVAY